MLINFYIPALTGESNLNATFDTSIAAGTDYDLTISLRGTTIDISLR